MNKKAGVLFNSIAAILMFSLVIVVFYTVPNQIGGFWDKYSYTSPANTLESRFDVSSDIDTVVTQVNCDISDVDSCDTEKKSTLQQTSEFIGGIVQGGYGGLITIKNSFGTTKTLTLETGQELNIPPAIIGIFVTLILALITITILLIIFNRSDTL